MFLIHLSIISMLNGIIMMSLPETMDCLIIFKALILNFRLNFFPFHFLDSRGKLNQIHCDFALHRE